MPRSQPTKKTTHVLPPPACPNPQGTKVQRVLDDMFLKASTRCQKTKSQRDPSDNLSVPRRNFVTAPTRFCECPGENLWMPWRIFRRRPTKFCECPDEIPNEILEAARRNLTTPPTKCPTKVKNEILGWFYEIKKRNFWMVLRNPPTNFFVLFYYLTGSDTSAKGGSTKKNRDS